MNPRSAFAERSRLKDQKKQQEFAKLVAATIGSSHGGTENNIPTSDLDTIRTTNDQLKDELRQSKDIIKRLEKQSEESMQKIKNLESSFKDTNLNQIVEEQKEKHDDLYGLVGDFIKEKLSPDRKSKIDINDVNYELVEYCKERGTFVNTREIRRIMEKHGIKTKISTNSGNIYYIGVTNRDDDFIGDAETRSVMSTKSKKSTSTKKSKTYI